MKYCIYTIQEVVMKSTCDCISNCLITKSNSTGSNSTGFLTTRVCEIDWLCKLLVGGALSNSEPLSGVVILTKWNEKYLTLYQEQAATSATKERLNRVEGTFGEGKPAEIVFTGREKSKQNIDRATSWGAVPLRWFGCCRWAVWWGTRTALARWMDEITTTNSDKN